MSLVSIQHFMHSQVNKIENDIALNDYELNTIIPEAVEILKNNFSNHACTENEKTLLTEIYKDIQILTKESKEHALFDLKKKIKGIIRTGYFADNFSNVKKGSFENFKLWVSSNLDSIKKSLSISIFTSFYSPYEQNKKYKNNQKKIHELTKLLEETKPELKKKQLDLDNNPENKNLKIEVYKLKTKIDSAEIQKKELLESYDVFEKSQQKAIDTKNLFVDIGGERLNLKTKDKFHLDGMYLSAKEFREKLINANIQSFKVENSFISKKFPIQNGLIFDKNNQDAKKLINTLEKLNILKMGYVKLEIGNKIALVSEDQVQQLTNFKFADSFIKALSIKQILPLQEEKTPTIMLGGSAKGVFEMEKRNSLSFLMNGLNVMMFNYRGHGLSEGHPTPEGTYKDVETAYQYLKQVKKVNDNQIIAKGLSLSGGIMAHLASKHPEINLFLDQTYAEIKNIALKRTDDAIQGFLSLFQKQDEKIQIEQSLAFKIIRSLIAPAIKLLSPKYTTLKGIEKTKGKVLILESKEDILIPRKELEQMLDHAAKSGTLQQITVASIPGEHGTMWMDAKETIEDKTGKEKTYDTGKALVNHFLSSLNFYNPIIPTKKVENKDIVSPATKKAVKSLEKALKKESVQKVSEGWEELEL